MRREQVDVRAWIPVERAVMDIGDDADDSDPVCRLAWDKFAVQRITIWPKSLRDTVINDRNGRASLVRLHKCATAPHRNAECFEVARRNSSESRDNQGFSSFRTPSYPECSAQPVLQWH